MSSLHKTFLSGSLGKLEDQTENKRRVNEKTDGQKDGRKEGKRENKCKPSLCFKASKVLTLLSQRTHHPWFGGVLYKIFFLLPQSCKIPPLHCTDPQQSQPCTNINKQTHTYTHIDRQNLTSDRLASVLFLGFLSFKACGAETQRLPSSRSPLLQSDRRREKGERARHKMEIGDGEGQKSG